MAEHHPITIDGETITGEFNDSPTAQDLGRQLPLTLVLGDYNNVKIIRELPLLHDHVGYLNGLVRIRSLLADGTGSVTGTVFPAVFISRFLLLASGRRRWWRTRSGLASTSSSIVPGLCRSGPGIG